MNMRNYSWLDAPGPAQNRCIFTERIFMSRDLLLLLEYGFTDPAHPGQRFICPDCAPIDGLLAQRHGFARVH